MNLSRTDDVERITATDGEAFRRWLTNNHDTANAVWLVYFKKHTTTPSIAWSEAVDQALCFGWIDSKIQPLDDERYEQYFCPRRPTSPWSRVNKDKIKQLDAAGLIEPAGRRAIETAKANGSWTVLDDAENQVIPDELNTAFRHTQARQFFDQLSTSRRRNVLKWIALAKRDDTRRRRIQATADAAARGETPNGL